MKIYLAHPISGLSYDTVHDYYANLSILLSEFFYVFHPMTAKGYLRNEIEFRATGYNHMPVSTNHAIVERDNWMISQSDIVLVDLTGAKAVSIGCIMELAWAHLMRKHSVVVMDEHKIHNHAFVLECADVVFSSLDEAIEYLKKLHHGIF
jgi:nucleoside 2-deoxyribosyltransferase